VVVSSSSSSSSSSNSTTSPEYWKFGPLRHNMRSPPPPHTHLSVVLNLRHKNIKLGLTDI
jgi:hypothetical protein